MTRRDFVSLASAAAVSAVSPLAAATLDGTPPKTRMGIASTSYMTYRRFSDPSELLEHAHALGAGGIQAGLSTTDPAVLKKLRARAEELGMYIEAMANLPKKDDSGAFENSIQAAKIAGALCVRTACLSGRRYENFKSLAEWQQFTTESIAAIKRAIPIVEKQRVALAIENHKDWTVQELAAILKDSPSEYLGVCLDFGNNISLLDDPMEVVETLAPHAFSVHVKDMGVEPYRNGFLLSEVPLGEGILDLKKMVATVRKARPDTRITLEMITRNPLEVPCLTEKYWGTYPERSGLYLARTLQMVHKESDGLSALPRMDLQSKPALLRLEDENVKICLHYARERLQV
ncbi:MAG: sugar phosphate isomerase/epimerase [Acidobacteriota bacterium]|nr:sugar phosphate isomerase/epimerase [Acidobacteriota bacterium]